MRLAESFFPWSGTLPNVKIHVVEGNVPIESSSNFKT